MYCSYQDREEFEDDLYKEDEGDSEDSEVNSELEFNLYSQLHYSSNAGVMEEQLDGGDEEGGQGSLLREVTEKDADVDGEQKHTEESRCPLPDISKIQQHLKKKKKREKHDIRKKGKSNPKGQRSSSVLFEEVIVIDSSPDVISISEDDSGDDDDGVCALKDQGSRRLKTSTLVQQGSQGRKTDLGAPMTVDSSSSKCDSEQSGSKSLSDSSDSDYLENWMILGRGNQDGDQAISLNLEQGSDSRADVEEEEGTWLVSDKDKEAQIYNRDKGARMTVQRVSNRYYTSKSIQCRNCNKNGHLSKNCLMPKKLSPCFLCGTSDHFASQCPNRHCNNCGLPGHSYDSCSERAYWHKQCHRCSMRGHFFDACPEIWRQYHITTKTGVPIKQQKEDQGRRPAYCYNCSKEGHFGYACTRQRMFNGTYPSTPFVNYYDNMKDITRRQRRMDAKAKVLKKNGFFTPGSQTPLTPGPLKKKQKTGHHKNNWQPTHGPHQSPKNPIPSPSHIFFNDKYDFRAPTPKKNKYKQQESTSNVKPWKPKRPVPTSRDPPPRLKFDEADDLPRGGGKAAVIMKKKKWKKKKKPSGKGDGDSKRDGLVGTGEMQRSKSEKKRRKSRRIELASRTANKNVDAPMYPTDENLFIIKQRKRNR